MVLTEPVPTSIKERIVLDTVEQKLFSYCHDPSLIRRLDLVPDYMMSSFTRRGLFDLSTKLPINDRFRELAAKKQMAHLRMPVGKSELSYYWANHSMGYQELVTGLEGRLSDIPIDNNTKLVLIPAMNEKDLRTPIEAVRSSYGDGGSKDLPVVIFHNYKGEKPTSQSLEAVREASELPNVHVITVGVPDFSTVTLAKKILTDVIIHKLDKNIPLILMDADVVELSKGIVQEAQRNIGDLDILKLAASPYFDFPEELKQKHPVFKFIQDFRRRLDDLKFAANINLKNTIGPFTYVDSHTLVHLGGLKPVIYEKGKLHKIAFEDMQLSEDMRYASGYKYHGKDPVMNLGRKGYFAYVSGDREIHAFKKGLANQWTSSHYYSQVSGNQRGEGTVDTFDNEPTPNNLAKALTAFWGYHISGPGVTVKSINRDSKLLFQILEEMGYKADVGAVNFFGDSELVDALKSGFPLDLAMQLSKADKAEGERAERGVKQTAPWGIFEIKSVAKV